MQIVEIKNNLAKIVYNPAEEILCLSSFLKIQDSSQMFIAQVINLDAKNDNHFAIIKILFSYDNSQGFIPYNGAIPSMESSIQIVDPKQLLNLIETSQPLILGKLSESLFKIDISLIKDKTLVCIENKEEYERFIESILPQIVNLGKRVVLFDITGTVSNPNKFVAGQNLKLPLNYEAINFIYEKGLSEANKETKALLQDIFIEVQNYVKNIPEKYIPFDTFKNVVDSQYEELKLNELILLKNKLLKFYEEGVFAQDKSDFENLRNTLKSSPITMIDVSKFDGILQREFISYVYSVMKELGSEFYSFVQIEDDNTDKKLLKQIFITENVYSLIISPYRYKYLKEIKQLSKNLILFTPIQQQDDFAGYNVFLSKLNHCEFIIYGDKTKYIPFIVSLLPKENIESKPVEEIPHQQYQNKTEETTQTSYSETYTEEVTGEESLMEENSLNTDNLELPPEIQEQTEIPQDELPPELPDDEILPEIQEQAEIPQDELPPELPDDEILPEIQEQTEIPQDELPPELPDDEILPEIQEQAEIPQDELPPELPDDEILPEIQEQTEFPQDELPPELPDDEILPENIDESIARDLNKMESVPASKIQTVADSSLTDEDLDFIQENVQPEQIQDFEHSENEQLQTEHENILKPQLEQREQQLHAKQQEFKEVPIVPVYPAETPEASKSNQQFAQGDVVIHENYGKGVVTKLISYGEKILCSIDFENSGKKLLDPAITQLEKI